MKKILVFMFLILLQFVLVGCDLFGGYNTFPTTTTTTTVTTTTERPGLAGRQFILAAIQQLPLQEDDTDSVYEPDYSGRFLGGGKFILYDSSTVSLILLEGSEMCVVSFDLDEAGSIRTGYWNVDITYQDEEREIYLYVSFYWYGALFYEDFKTEYVEASVRTFREKLLSLETEDVLWMLAELGFPGVQKT